MADAIIPQPDPTKCYSCGARAVQDGEYFTLMQQAQAGGAVPVDVWERLDAGQRDALLHFGSAGVAK